MDGVVFTMIDTMLYDLLDLFENSFGVQGFCIGSEIWRDYMVKFRETLEGFFYFKLGKFGYIWGDEWLTTNVVVSFVETGEEVTK